MFLIARKDLPDVLTSYDLVKTLAILLVIIDHVGNFFFPENEWFRVLGRACIPIWCFLIGYATSRDLSPPIWIGAGILVAGNFLFGGTIFPLNILVTFILIRLTIDGVAKLIFRDWEWMTYSVFALCVLAVPTMILTEYGTEALLLALAGYVRRHEGEAQVNISASTIKGFIVFCVFSYALFEITTFGFHGAQAKAAVIGIGLSGLLMYYFRPMQLQEQSWSWPAPVVDLLKITGRWTMEIYVLHLVAFKAIASYLGTGGYGWFEWDWLLKSVG